MADLVAEISEGLGGFLTAAVVGPVMSVLEWLNSISTKAVGMGQESPHGGESKEKKHDPSGPFSMFIKELTDTLGLLVGAVIAVVTPFVFLGSVLVSVLAFFYSLYSTGHLVITAFEWLPTIIQAVVSGTGYVAEAFTFLVPLIWEAIVALAPFAAAAVPAILIGAAIQLLLPIIKNLIGSFLSIIGVVATVVWAFNPLTFVISAVVGIFSQLSAVLTGNWMAIRSATEGLEKFNNWLVTTFVTHPIKQVFGQMTAEATGLLEALGGITDSMGEFVDSITKASSAMIPFVQALAPSLVQQFHYALRTLQATIGTALAPAFQVLSRMITNVAGILAPAMQALAPVMSELASYASQVLLPVVQELAAGLSTVTPHLVQFASATVPLFNAFRVMMTAVIRALMDWITALIGTGGDGLKKFEHAVMSLAKVLVVASAQIALLFGATGYVEALKKVLVEMGGNGQRPQGVAPAPEGVHTGGLEDIMRRMAEESVTAGGGPAPDDPQLKVMTEILEAVKAAKKEDLMKVLKNVWEETVRGELATFVEIAILAAWEVIKTTGGNMATSEFRDFLSGLLNLSQGKIRGLTS